MTEDELTKLEFVDSTVGMNIPRGFIPGIEKGFLEVCDRGTHTGLPPCLVALSPSRCGSLSSGLLTGHKLVGVRMVLEDGVSHSVDSSEMAFKSAAIGAMRQGIGL